MGDPNGFVQSPSNYIKINSMEFFHPVVESMSVLENRVLEFDRLTREIKMTGVIMEADQNALAMTEKLQAATRELIVAKYGHEPYCVTLDLTFPDSMKDKD